MRAERIAILLVPQTLPNAAAPTLPAPLPDRLVPAGRSQWYVCVCVCVSVVGFAVWGVGLCGCVSSRHVIAYEAYVVNMHQHRMA